MGRVVVSGREENTSNSIVLSFLKLSYSSFLRKRCVVSFFFFFFLSLLDFDKKISCTRDEKIKTSTRKMKKNVVGDEKDRSYTLRSTSSSASSPEVE